MTKSASTTWCELDRQGMKWRAIARALRISRNTVRQIVREHGRPGKQPALGAADAGRRPAAHRSSIAFGRRSRSCFRLYPDITAQRVFESLRDAGLRRRLHRGQRPGAPDPPQAGAPAEPGDARRASPGRWPSAIGRRIAVAFTHAPPMTLQAFGYTLRYSTRKFYSFHEGNGLHPLMDGHVHAFERFAGAARRCKYDNQKPVVLRWEGSQPIYNPRFIDFATYYEFSPVACRPGIRTTSPGSRGVFASSR